MDQQYIKVETVQFNIGSTQQNPTLTSYTCKPIYKHNLSIFRLHSIQLTGFNMIDVCLAVQVAAQSFPRYPGSPARRSLKRIMRAMP